MKLPRNLDSSMNQEKEFKVRVRRGKEKKVKALFKRDVRLGNLDKPSVSAYLPSFVSMIQSINILAIIKSSILLFDRILNRLYINLDC